MYQHKFPIRNYKIGISHKFNLPISIKGNYDQRTRNFEIGLDKHIDLNIQLERENGDK